MRILVVDKLASFRKKLRHWLADGGHGQENILEAGSGQAAMDLLRREEFNV
ncbi:MAG: response regulator, partial [Planctomycetia bacterium]|nr:response regulator [Planctomycetia bacterium]